MTLNVNVHDRRPLFRQWKSVLYVFWSGILPCEMFIYPDEEKTFIAKLRLMEELQPRMDAAQATHDDGVL